VWLRSLNGVFQPLLVAPRQPQLHRGACLPAIVVE
jgi:hypothetical protein